MRRSRKRKRPPTTKTNVTTEFAPQEEAHALCTAVFWSSLVRCIYISFLAEGRPWIGDVDLKQLMAETNQKLTELLEQKAADPPAYWARLEYYRRLYISDELREAMIKGEMQVDDVPMETMTRALRRTARRRQKGTSKSRAAD
jgi:hypothetical protein